MALELIRSAQSTLHSIADIVDYLRQLVSGKEKHDGLPAAAPLQPPARIMNLHQAKGFEAPVVFLADPMGKKDYEPELHVDRSGDCVRGFMRISVSRGEHSSEELAHPAEWEAHAEKEFQDAEKNRLLYVAATRAGRRLVVSQREKRNGGNPWSSLQDHLAACPAMTVPETKVAAERPERRIEDKEPAIALERTCQRWTSALRPSYALAAAKAVSVTSSKLAPSSGEHGTEWGSVIHLLLDNAMQNPEADLNSLAQAALSDQGLDSSFVEQALAMMQAVMRSDIWRRAHSVPEQTVRRRYDRGLRNFFRLYQPLATTWAMYDNSEAAGMWLIAAERGNRVTEQAEPLIWRQIQQEYAHGD